MQTFMMILPLPLLVTPELSARSLLDSADYDSCVAESMKAITSRKAAEDATRTCRAKLGETEFQNADLPPDAFGKLIIHAGFGYGIFSGSIYNGNNDYTITQISVLVTPAGKNKPAEASAEGREYNIDLTVQPFSKSALSMPILSDTTQEYAWKVTKARGYKTR